MLPDEAVTCVKRKTRKRTSRLLHIAAACIGFAWLAFAARGAFAQDLEPRSYVNTPVGLNFLIGAYGYVDGNVAFDPEAPIADAHYHQNTVIAAYARSFGLFGNSAKFDVIVPYSHLTGSALQTNGVLRERDVEGFNDPRFRLSYNFYGAPALAVKDFGSYKQDLIIGASLQIGVPLGQYDSSKVVNLGNNRWMIKPELGISKAWGPWIVEVAPSVTFYTNNTDFNNGKTFEQDPLYSLQTHVVYGFSNGMWLAGDAIYFHGARSKVNGVQDDNLQSNTRGGLTLAIPVDRNNSLKLNVSGGTSSRTGSGFTLFGIAWQYRWGGGY